MQEDAAETTIKTFDFSGDIKKFRVWESKTLALAKAKGFYAALTTDIGPNITCEEYEFGIVLDKLSGIERLPSLTEIRKYTSTQNAWAYLSSSCKGMAFGLIEHCNDQPFKAWSILQSKFMACDEEANLPDLDMSFVMCKLDGTKRDPELWFNEIDYLNNRMARIDPRYMKQEMQIKSHIICNLSQEYESVIIKFRGEIADTPLEKIKKEITLHYDYLLKHKGQSQEVALTVS